MGPGPVVMTIDLDITAVTEAAYRAWPDAFSPLQSPSHRLLRVSDDKELSVIG